jgi:hypothetical protein
MQPDLVSSRNGVYLMRITHRDSMRSEYVIHYELATDLPADEVQRRLRGNVIDRFRTWLHKREYRRWERSRHGGTEFIWDAKSED